MSKKERSRFSEAKTSLIRASFLGAYLFFSSLAFSAEANFYTLNEKWEKSNFSGQSKKDALNDGFTAAFSRQPIGLTEIPPPPPLERKLSGLAQGGLTEIEHNQSLYVKAGSALVKFVTTEEGIVSMETVGADTLRIVGTAIGRTFVHVWDGSGRSTFEIQVLQRKIVPSSFQIRQMEAIEKSRSFKIGYDNNRSAFYTGEKFQDKSRTSVDFTQNFRLEGDTPYGAVSSRVQTQKSKDKTLLTDAQFALKDGKIGPYKNFNLALGDSTVKPGLMVFPGGRIRGAQLEHWDDPDRLRWTAFHGREESSIIGTLTPGIVSKRTLSSKLTGAVMDYKVSDNAKLKAGYFGGAGQSRADQLNRKGMGLAGEMDFGPHVTFNQETDFDNEHFAQKYAVTTKFEKLRIKNELRDISKKFFTLLGPPSRQGEVGYLLDVSAQPFDNVSFSGTFDMFRDRLIPNPVDTHFLNYHTDLLLSVIPRENSSLSFNFQDLDDTGRLGPTRQRTVGMQYNQKFAIFGHKATFFTRYQNRGNRVLNNSLTNYVQNQGIVGLYTQIFWDINFSIQQEWNGVKEPNINRFTRPRALVYTWDYAHQIGDTPFFMDARLRIRDEEDTESISSFMSGEDSTEISGGLYYREYEDLEIFLTGSFSNYVAESLNVTAPRTEAQFMTGIKGTFDTHFRWSAVGSFEGYVFKDKNGDGIRQADEQGIEGMKITTSDGKEALTDENGRYQLKSVAGKKAVLTLDNSKIPYGYAPTSSLRQEAEIVHKKTQVIDFSLTPRSEIAGVVFNDLDGNGKYELSDIGVRKVKVALEDGTAARSNTIGAYSFPSVVAGEHTASLVLSTVPEGYLPLEVPKKTFTVYEGLRYELNFPLKAIRAVTGRVYVDTNKNGNLDLNERTVSGVRVLLRTLGETPSSRTMESDSEGWYLFDQLNKGDYELTVDPSSLPTGLKDIFGKVRIEMPVDPMTVSDRNIALSASNVEPENYSEETV